jgi:hypothetical protein
MKTNSIIAFMLMIFACALVHAQDLPPKHRGMHPRLTADGKVVDETGKQLGYITKDGKVCDVTGKVIGIVAETGNVTTAKGKGIVGVIQKDGSFKAKEGHVVTTDPDGVVKVAGKMVGHVDKGYTNKAHGCALHCFFSADNEHAEGIDKEIDQ